MSGQRRVFYGWVVVATSALALFFSGAPIVVYSFSVFLKPLSQEFQAGRELFPWRSRFIISSPRSAPL